MTERNIKLKRSWEVTSMAKQDTKIIVWTEIQLVKSKRSTWGLKSRPALVHREVDLAWYSLWRLVSISCSSHDSSWKMCTTCCIRWSDNLNGPFQKRISNQCPSISPQVQFIPAHEIFLKSCAWKNCWTWHSACNWLACKHSHMILTAPPPSPYSSEVEWA